MSFIAVLFMAQTMLQQPKPPVNAMSVMTTPIVTKTETVHRHAPQTTTAKKPTPAPKVPQKKAPQGRKIRVVATAYDTSPAENGGYTISATGHKLRRGIIAVDPRVIPLGSIVHIPGYGEGWAVDTGGKIRGSRIDLCNPSRSWCNRFGRRKVEVTIVGYKSPFKSKRKK